MDDTVKNINEIIFNKRFEELLRESRKKNVIKFENHENIDNDKSSIENIQIVIFLSFFLY